MYSQNYCLTPIKNMDGHFISDACSYYFSGGSNELTDLDYLLQLGNFIGSLPPLSNENGLNILIFIKKY